ncbi:MAG: dTMP kinase [Lachnospiraceae bacterium]
MKGIFISIEGADGSGKTTQIQMLKKYFEEKGFDVIVTREPGGTKISEQIRSIILDKTHTNMSYITEMLLYAAARAQLVEQIIAPAKKEGKIIISDRFIDSSAVYQGIARGLGTKMVYDVNQYAIAACEPDITFLLDIDATEGIGRKKNQKNLDRMEQETIDFHQMVADGYRRLAKEHTERIHMIDASQTIEKIQEEILRKLQQIMAE